MLYTVVPLERIYSYRTESVLGNTRQDGSGKPEPGDAEYKNITLKHGNVYTRREGTDYVVEGISSTDMADYLNKEYMPGARIKSDR